MDYVYESNDELLESLTKDLWEPFMSPSKWTEVTTEIIWWFWFYSKVAMKFDLNNWFKTRIYNIGENLWEKFNLLCKEFKNTGIATIALSAKNFIKNEFEEENLNVDPEKIPSKLFKQYKDYHGKLNDLS